MFQAVICPVCNGTGKYNGNQCHGCDGKGWVEVGKHFVNEPLPYSPYYPIPYIYPSITWTDRTITFC